MMADSGWHGLVCIWMAAVCVFFLFHKYLILLIMILVFVNEPNCASSVHACIFSFLLSLLLYLYRSILPLLFIVQYCYCSSKKLCILSPFVRLPAINDRNSFDRTNNRMLEWVKIPMSIRLSHGEGPAETFNKTSWPSALHRKTMYNVYTNKYNHNKN